MAGGGEGSIYVVNWDAIKIYHNPSKMIAVDKIKELCNLKLDNVLAPKYVVYDEKNNAIGFGMKFISSTEFLCKLFNKSYKIWK